MFSHVRSRSKSQSSTNSNQNTQPSYAPSTPPLGSYGTESTSSTQNNRRSYLPKLSAKHLLGTPEMPKLEKDPSLSHEMIPVLTLLGSHGSRVYIEGYFMILAELNNDGQPIPDRKWAEVYGTLQGTMLTMWNASKLDEGKHETTFINAADSYMRSISSLGPDLSNVIVLSSTMKNRYLLQFGTRKLYNEWSAALRLAAFERISLQEAYTGALLSSKGSQLQGIRALLSESRFKTESWCNVRFGVGMPWKRVWAVVTPNEAIKVKKERKKLAPYGKVELFSDPKDKKKKPLAIVHRAFAAFAVFPEKSVLVNVSSLLKVECFVEFDGDNDVRESALFIMPEQHAGIQGFETLIRFLIPILDVFNLYGRPKRLNADKSDMNSLLFGMPSLPRAYYLDVVDVFLLAALPDSDTWSSHDWNTKIKELIAQKMTMDYQGTGTIRQSSSPDSSLSERSSPTGRSSLALPNGVKDTFVDRSRVVSDPSGDAKLFTSNSNGSANSLNGPLSSSGSGNKYAPAVPSPLQHSRPAPKAPVKSGATIGPTANGSVVNGPVSGQYSESFPGGVVPVSNDNSLAPPTFLPPAVASTAKGSSTLQVPSSAPRGPRDLTVSHQRGKSEGEKVEKGLLSPNLSDLPSQFMNGSESRLTLASNDSFVSAAEENVPAKAPSQFNRSNIFDPNFRPTHQSYNDYSEYMHEYLDTLSTKNDSKSVAVGKPRQLEGAYVGTENLSHPATSQSKGHSPAQLLSTPIRTPEVSRTITQPATAQRLEVSPPQSTALAGPKVGAYPNAPGSPQYEKARPLDQSNGKPGQDKPSGPRPQPSSYSPVRKPVPASLNPSSTFGQREEPPSSGRNAAMTPQGPPQGGSSHVVPGNSQFHSGQSHSAQAKVSSAQGVPQPNYLPKHVQPTPQMYAHGPPQQGNYQGYAQGYRQNQSQGYDQSYQQAYRNPPAQPNFASHANSHPQQNRYDPSLQTQQQNMQQRNQYAPGNRMNTQGQVPPQGLRGPTQAPYNFNSSSLQPGFVPKQQAQGTMPLAQGTAKTGPVLRPVKDIRAQQLRSQAMGNNPYGQL